MEPVNPSTGKPAKTVISFVRWTVALTLLMYVCLTAVEEYRLSSSSSPEESYGILSLKASGLKEAVVSARLWERPRSRKLVGLGNTGANSSGTGFTMKMLHRNSVESPYRKAYATQADALSEYMDIDEMRLAVFRQRTRRSFIMDSTNINANDISPSSAASPPTITAVIEGPGASPSTNDYNFQSPLVSGSTLGSGQYFVDFYLGTPPQKFSLIVDSGSDLIWVQCEPCKSCYPQDGPLYDPGNSSSFSPVPCLSKECLLIPAIEGFPCDFRYPGACAYEYQYADTSSTKGVFAFETATLDDGSNFNVRIDQVAFGCGNENEGSFAAAGGVIGLGQGPLSFTSQIGYAYGNKFSYCLVNYLDPTSVASSLVFGDGDKHAGELQQTPIVKNRHSPTLYYVQIVDVSVAGQTLAIPDSAWSIGLMGDGGSVFDSGTTLTYFVPDAYTLVLQAFDQAITYPRVTPVQNLDLCFNISGVDNPSFPSFAINFQDGALFQPPSDNYLVDVAPGVKCLAMQGLPPPATFGFNTIGNLMQQNYLVVYDRDNHRIGFTPTQCSHL